MTTPQQRAEQDAIHTRNAIPLIVFSATLVLCLCLFAAVLTVL